MTAELVGDAKAQRGSDELRRLNRAYRALSLCNGNIVRAASEQELLEASCNTLVSVGGYVLVWVGFAVLQGSRVRPVAKAGSESAKAYLDEIHISCVDDEHGRGPTGSAMRTGEIVVNRDSGTNPSYGPWREQALRHGFRSSIALPLRYKQQTLGVLAVYAAFTDAFDSDEQRLLVDFADNLAFGLAALRAREELAIAEDELRRATDVRARFAILDDAPNAFMALDHESRCVYVNEACARQVGHTRASLLGRVIWEVFPQTVETAFWNAYRRAMETREVIELEEYFAPRDRWFEVRVYPIETGVAVYFSDISARKQLELTLRDSEERFRQMAESIEDVFWLSAPDRSRMFYVNPAYEKIWGRSRDALYAHPRDWIEAIHPEDRERVAQSLQGKTEEGWEWSYRVIQPNGAVRFIRDRAGPVLDDAGRVHRIAGVARDVTEYRRLEDQFHHAQKLEAVGRLAGGVAHDFNNLLSVILSYTQLVLDELPRDQPWRTDIEDVHRAAERATDLTRQLLAFSRRQVLQPRLINLNRVISDMESMLRRVLGADVDLCLRIARPLRNVHADPSQLEQIVMNLVVNARDAMPHGGTLSIETLDVELSASDVAGRLDVAPGRYVQLTVKDTGVGMDAGTREHIFEPFFTTKGLGKGTGLGLSTVFGIVKQSGGCISVESEPTVGTTFTIYLPSAAMDAMTTPPPVHEPVTLRGNETILLVEDDDQVRALASAILRRQGYDVLDAQNAGEALLICERHGAPIQLLLTDMVLPRLSGKELASRLAPLRPEMRVLYLSGYSEETFEQSQVLDAGIAFLQKPITPDALLRRVREVLEASTPSRVPI